MTGIVSPPAANSSPEGNAPPESGAEAGGAFHTSLREDRRRQFAFFRLLTRRDLKSRYAGSTLGSVWSFIHPISMILIYIMLFSSLMRNSARGASSSLVYTAHLCTGMLVWLTFSETLNRCAGTLVENAAFLKKIWFPPWLLHASALFNVLLIHIGGFAALMLLLVLIGFPVSAGAVFVPALMLLAGIAAAGLGLILSGLNVFFRDTAQALIIALQVGFWLNPIVYPLSQVQHSMGSWAFLFRLSPMESFISLAQTCVGDPSASPAAGAPWVIALFPLACLAAGSLAFGRMIPDVRDSL